MHDVLLKYCLDCLASKGNVLAFYIDVHFVQTRRNEWTTKICDKSISNQVGGLAEAGKVQ